MDGTTTIKDRIAKIIKINKKYNKNKKLKDNIILAAFNFSKKFLDEIDFEELKNEMSIHAAVIEVFDEEMEKRLKKGKIKGKIEIAKNLIKEGYSINEIIKITGLNKKEIEIIITNLSEDLTTS